MWFREAPRTKQLQRHVLHVLRKETIARVYARKEISLLFIRWFIIRLTYNSTPAKTAARHTTHIINGWSDGMKNALGSSESVHKLCKDPPDWIRVHLIPGQYINCSQNITSGRVLRVFSMAGEGNLWFWNSSNEIHVQILLHQHQNDIKREFW